MSKTPHWIGSRHPQQYNVFEGRFLGPISHLRDQLAGIRPGSIGVGFIETFRHANRRIGDIATVTVVKDRIHVMPHNRADCGGIVKSLEAGKLNAFALNPATVCVPIPPMSGEQKAEMVAHIRRLGEEAKVAIRSMRQDARKKAGDDDLTKKEIQDATDRAVEEVVSMVEAKVKSL